MSLRKYTVLLAALAVMPAAAQIVVEPSSGDCEAIQNAIDSLPPEGGRILIKAGTYLCAKPIVINRDAVQLSGEGRGTVLSLRDGANSPVLVIGQTDPVPAVTRRDIVVSDLVIDGNREQQTHECMGGPCEGERVLRNNGITLRSVADSAVRRVLIVRARSGGLVTELGCIRLTIEDLTSASNQFDGLAVYKTIDSTFSRLRLVDNLWAGFSADHGFNQNILSGMILTGNRDVGIFMRNSRGNVFEGLQIHNNGNHGIFLAQIDTDAGTPAAGNTFSSGVISGSQGWGLLVNNESCVDNQAVGIQFRQNRDGCVFERTPGLTQSSAIICR